jgi:hypothetical protein
MEINKIRNKKRDVETTTAHNNGPRLDCDPPQMPVISYGFRFPLVYWVLEGRSTRWPYVPISVQHLELG